MISLATILLNFVLSMFTGASHRPSEYRGDIPFPEKAVLFTGYATYEVAILI
jgi:hypothetical protein